MYMRETQTLLSLEDLRDDLALAQNAGSALGPTSVNNALTKDLIEFISLKEKAAELPDAFYFSVMSKIHDSIAKFDLSVFPGAELLDDLGLMSRVVQAMLVDGRIVPFMKEAVSHETGLVAGFHNDQLFAHGTGTAQFLVNSMRDTIRFHGVLRDTFNHSSMVMNPFGPISRLSGGTFAVEGHEQAMISCRVPNPGCVLHMYISGVSMVPSYSNAADKFVRELMTNIATQWNTIFTSEGLADRIAQAQAERGLTKEQAYEEYFSNDVDDEEGRVATQLRNVIAHALLNADDTDKFDAKLLELMRQVMQGQMLRPCVTVAASPSHNQLIGLPVNGTEVFAAKNIGFASMETLGSSYSDNMEHAVDGNRTPAEMARQSLYPYVVYCT